MFPNLPIQFLLNFLNDNSIFNQRNNLKNDKCNMFFSLLILCTQCIFKNCCNHKVLIFFYQKIFINEIIFLFGREILNHLSMYGPLTFKFG